MLALVLLQLGGVGQIASGYLLAFPFASAIVAEGLDRSAKSETANFNSLLICWTFAMIPVYIVGTLWLAEAYGVGFAQAFEWGVEPFLIWDFAKILVMALRHLRGSVCEVLLEIFQVVEMVVITILVFSVPTWSQNWLPRWLLVKGFALCTNSLARGAHRLTNARVGSSRHQAAA